ncbi:MAG: redoxin domain-containing protein [Bacteroidales bacterium]|nr:redoxin domain-containing protein [Bacteroidales bacterium]
MLHPEVYPDTREITVLLPFLDKNQPQKYVAPIGHDGSFSLLLFPYTRRDGSIQTFVDRFIIAPGDSLHVEIDFADLTYVHFSGPAARDNDAMAVYMLKYLPDRWPAEYGHTQMEFVEAMRQQREEYLTRLEEFAREESPSEALLSWCRRELDIRYYTRLIDRLHIYRHDFGSESAEASLFRRSDVMALFTDTLINSSQFELASWFASWTAREMVHAAQERGLTDEYTAYDQIIRDSIPNRLLAETLIAGDFYRRLVRNEVDRYEAGVDAFNAWVVSPFLKVPVQEYYLVKSAYRQDPSRLSDQMLHPEKRNSDKASIEAQPHPFLDMLNDIIQQSGGQVLYISLGAAWCEPCILQKKGQNRLIEEFKGQPLRVIAIYMDPEENLRHIEQIMGFPFLAEEFFLTKDQGQDLNQQLLKSHGIPYYILVDKQGRIVDYGNHLGLADGWYDITVPKIRALVEDSSN